MVMCEKISRKISYLLRHDPEDLHMARDGYVLVDDLLIKLDITMEVLDDIVMSNDKKRFAYSSDKTKIRASQGHSIDVSIKMEVSPFIKELYHGTKSSLVSKIMKTGISKMSRKYVHLSKDLDTAINVASRHSSDISILIIDSARMRADNIKIYISENNVYLTDDIDPKYILKVVKK
jgi:putative RNA 2'-phosphotransferase